MRFNSTSEANDAANQRFNVPTRRDRSPSPVIPVSVTPSDLVVPSPSHSRNTSMSSLLRHTPETENENPFEDAHSSPIPKPKASAFRKNLAESSTFEDVEDFDEKAFSALAAQERAQRIATLVGSHSAPTSARTSLDEVDDEDIPFRPSNIEGLPVMIDDIPLVDMSVDRTYDGAGLENDVAEFKNGKNSEAHELVRVHTRKYRTGPHTTSSTSGLGSGHITPTEERTVEDYVPRPQQYRPGILLNLLKLYTPHGGSATSSRPQSMVSLDSPTPYGSSTSSPGTSTPTKQHQKWYHQRNQSQDTLAGLIEASNILGGIPAAARKKTGPTRPGTGRRTHSGKLIGAASKLSGRPRLEDEIRITIHIAETLCRQKYLLKLCKALMCYGAPTHRLEEYMTMSARVLETDGQFLYMPGCMIISFDDASTHTTEVKLVKVQQGVDLGKLKDVHEIYKEVVHDVIGVEEATQRLDTIMNSKSKYNSWLLVLAYGFASATVAPYAFEGRLIDLPVAWFLGCLLGFLQLIVAPRSPLYSNVFEISAAVLTSFLARAFGSINGGNLFCFSALSQSAIALILPGYMVLCGSLELQSRSLVAGSVRMVYAIIYSLFLGYGITIGTAIYGLIDSNATSNTQCINPVAPYYRFIFVPIFTLCLTVINKAKWKQTPVMILIAFAGYVVNFFSARRFPQAPQISNTLGAFTVGVLGNLYSRVHHGVAAAALIPAIFVQVPSGLAATGSLLAGLSTADQLTNMTTYANGTARVNGTNVVPIGTGDDLNTIVFNVGFSMIQVAIGITVGLFLAALIVYPFGKRRSGLFSF